jgi:hypothetical protein
MAGKMPRLYGASLVLLLAGSIAVGGVAAGCEGGGGSTGGGAGGSDPKSQCEEFLTLTNECYAKAGGSPPANPAACSDTSALDHQALGQIECTLASKDAYCRAIAFAVTRDASVLSGNETELVKLNTCTAAKNDAGGS